MGMRKSKFLKTGITVFIILLLLTLFAFLFIYPAYDKISIVFNDLNPYRLSKNVYMSVLTRISPSLDTFDSQILSEKSIEDYLAQENQIGRTILEDLNTKVEIDSVNILGRISEGGNSQAMLKGFWHFPTSSYPGEQGNMVVIGHRFQYLPPAKNTFFYLDRVQIGDNIKIGGDNGEYTYIVTNIKVAEPNDISVLKKTDDYRLTLITCTPLWTSHQRLVITAKLDKLYKKV